MKILIVNSVFYPTQIGGAEISVYNLSDGLAQMGHEVHVVSISKHATIKEIKVLENGVICHYLPKINLYWPFDSAEKISKIKKFTQKFLDLFNILSIRPLNSLIKEINPEVIHTNNLKGISVAIWKIANLRKIPVIHTTRDYYLLCTKSSMRKNEKNCIKQCATCQVYSWNKMLLSKNVSYVVGISHHIMKSHINNNFFPYSNSRVIYNSAFISEQNHQIRTKSKGLNFGFLGRIETDKGLMQLINVISKLSNTHDVKLTVAGNGNSQIINEIRKYDFVHYIGRSTHKEFFPYIDFLAVPSVWNEPMGRVVIESYQYGVPVITNNTGGLPELVDDFKTGIVVDFSDTNYSKDKILELLNEDYQNLSANCIEKSKLFANKSMVSSYIELYKDATNG